MCPGIPEEKANLLFDLCLGPNDEMELNRTVQKEVDKEFGSPDKSRNPEKKDDGDDGEKKSSFTAGLGGNLLGSMGGLLNQKSKLQRMVEVRKDEIMKQ